MDLYPHLLKSACETWFKDNYSGLYLTALRLSGSKQTTRPGILNEELPELELKISVGPWKSIFVWFKSPGVVLSQEERECMNDLRNKGSRVTIVRHVEDFRTLIHTLLFPSKGLF
jgi:hypothetical protein